MVLLDVLWWTALVKGATADEAVLATVLEMAHIICLMRRIPRNNKERCGFITSKCMLGVRHVSCVFVSVVLLVVGGNEGHKCIVLESHVWHSLT